MPLDLIPPPEFLQHDTSEGLIQLIQQHGSQHGFAVVKLRSKKSKKGELKTVFLCCDRGRSTRESTSQQRTHAPSRRTDCPFQIVLRRVSVGGIWKIDVKNPNHNHLGSPPIAHPSQRRLALQQHHEQVLAAVRDNQKPAAIAASLNAQGDADAPAITAQDISNEKARIRRESLFALLPAPEPSQ